MKCKHNWRVLNRGFMNEAEETGEYECYYCCSCLAVCTVEYLHGKRTITNLSELTLLTEGEK